MQKIKVEWPTVAALAVVAVGLLVAYLAGPALGVPEESHAAFVAGLGALGAFALAAARQMLGIADDDDEPPPSGTPLLVLALVLSAAVHATACGGAAQQHRNLNRLTDVADPTYALAVDACDEARDFIVEREGSTEEADRADMADVVLVCDSIVEGFEALRGSQLTAREAIDGGFAGAAEAAILQGLASWAELQTLVPRIMAATSGGES